ncbi:SAM-dependent methyltransferase [Conexibacter sp. JD483]|uniref:SAM-dependent methyltransferase n=1 Tax=unclassified Conexibacter TaxID=2627773 RepID=UPI00271A8911|nr:MULTISPECIES: SAM-dependent methyltransferase [unclassified Conexibacter]MDO8186432.1 SAM-dependent methyltransferase [Conexibacter sp. CPCC 205706]MDO8200001.1 SAM-dependent methyltransferase [Conexibacter sp. CPCC 205762]MDR9370554.1 SAM-dependent methyltransferase [Conexibacter sp. JD483]
MRAADFEARYRAERDPWRYRSSPYERAKYAATLRACGRGPFEHALELGGSIGEFSALLAPRCRRLTTIDVSATAVERARVRVTGLPVDVLLGAIPDDLPHASFELVVASEVLYYLTVPQLTATLAALRARMPRGARLVAVHWAPQGPERPLSAYLVHAALRAQPWLRSHVAADEGDYLLDVLTVR